MDAVVVTFLFTDIEGSTRLWEQFPDAMQVALARHDEILYEAIEQQGGTVFKTIGDAFCAAFGSPAAALTAALTAQQNLASENWPDGISLAVRMALHSGAAEHRAGDYFGPPLNRVARLLAIAHGGQTLLSKAMQEAVASHLRPGASLLPHGNHRLRDLSEAEAVFELRHSILVTDFPPLRSLSTHPNNLPQQLTSFVGREKEMTAAKESLSTHRLLTLAGAGGSGKTRLALQAAADVLARFPDGIWLAELAPIGDAALVARTVADVLGIKEETRPLVQTLVEALREKELLLILDNCEHVLDASARLANALLKECPKVRLIVTSREALGITGEQTFRVPSLSLPSHPKQETAASITAYEAVNLFTERVQAVQPAFAITDENAPTLAQICHRLDGIPLALELAAARVRALSVEELNAKLDNRFRLLTGGSRTVLPRQQTLRAMIDWSYDLLSPTEKATLMRLSVFAGGWTLEAAEAVCMDDGTTSEPIEDWEVLDLLTSLTDKSLVVAEVQGGTTRYRLLETVRQYAREKLPDAAAAHDRHRDYFVGLSQEAATHLRGAAQREWLDRLDTEHDNLRAAMEWGDAETVLQMAVWLLHFWVMRGYVSEARELLARALEADCAPTVIRVEGLNTAGTLAWRQGDFGAAHALLEEGQELSTKLNYPAGIASALTNLGVVSAKRGDSTTAIALYQEALDIRRELGDKPGVGTLLNFMSISLSAQGNYALSEKYQQENLAIQRAAGDLKSIASALSNLGIDAQRQGDLDKAISLQEEVMQICRTLGDRQSLAATLNNTAVIYQIQGNSETAVTLHSEALAIQRDNGDRNGAAISQLGIGQAIVRMGQFEKATPPLMEALTWFHANDNSSAVANTLRLMGTMYVGMGEISRSVSLRAVAHTLSTSLDAPLEDDDRVEQEAQSTEARVALGNEAFDAAWAQGSTLSRDELLALAVSKPSL